MKAAIAVACVGAGVFALVLGLACVGGGAASSAAAVAPQLCLTTGPIRGLSSVAAANARIVTATAEQLGGSAGAVIAVMVADTESGLRVLGNATVTGVTGVGGGGVLPVQGEGGDHDSVGLFQQRGSWGSVVLRLDPAQSTRLFMTRLLAVHGWASKTPWVVAQDVQVSAFDGHPRAANGDSASVGGNYEANLPLARQVVAQIDADAGKLSCGALSGGVAASTAPGSHGLPAAYVVPAAATPAQSRVIVFAIAQLDKPYVFDAAGPGAYDCSGLTMAAWAQAGVSLPHSAAAQAASGTPTTVAALAPGDLVLVPGDDGTLAAPGHVGLYLGDGLVLNAADQQIGIRVQTYANFLAVGHGLSALRHLT